MVKNLLNIDWTYKWDHYIVWNIKPQTSQVNYIQLQLKKLNSRKNERKRS